MLGVLLKFVVDFASNIVPIYRPRATDKWLMFSTFSNRVYIFWRKGQNAKWIIKNFRSGKQLQNIFGIIGNLSINNFRSGHIISKPKDRVHSLQRLDFEKPLKSLKHASLFMPKCKLQGKKVLWHESQLFRFSLSISLSHLTLSLFLILSSLCVCLSFLF